MYIIQFYNFIFARANKIFYLCKELFQVALVSIVRLHTDTSVRNAVYIVAYLLLNIQYLNN